MGIREVSLKNGDWKKQMVIELRFVSYLERISWWDIVLDVCVPPNSYVEMLTSDKVALRAGVFGWWLFHKGRPSWMGLLLLWRTSHRVPLTFIHHVRIQEDGSLQPIKGPQQNLTILVPCSWSSSLQNCVDGSLSYQPGLRKGIRKKDTSQTSCFAKLGGRWCSKEKTTGDRVWAKVG
jgi:hypothetical protein